MKTSMSAYALRLPASMKAEAEKLAAEDGTSLNQFVATAVAEKVSALRTARYFTEKKGARRLGGVRPNHAPRGRRTAAARRRDSRKLSENLKNNPQSAPCP